MVSPERRSSQPASPAPTEEEYREYLHDVLARYITGNGTAKQSAALSELVEVTGRSMSAARNWLVYRQHLPDIESVAKIVRHWNIPLSEVFPRELPAARAVGADEPGAAAPAPFDINDLSMFPLFGPHQDAAAMEKALAGYTEQPRTAMLVRMAWPDQEPLIRMGDLMLVDSSQEQISRNGMYLLRIIVARGAPFTCVRMAVLQPGLNTVKLVCTNPLYAASEESHVLEDGLLPPHIAVLARVVGVMNRC
ncbi:hypothetical protein [Piscinibacter terrae]|uniref:Uncharacterized protein n=1 Tax=Piscinibacter terrae TaxID=2496871 RepID=A0A3N7HQP8_9BURK|nr:hypothetical protein [Albitalea terrae]RQP24524.1 hypothetical protein DZC73_14665 [Albitalea terrae]